jgi:hypothetical protein
VAHGAEDGAEEAQPESAPQTAGQAWTFSSEDYAPALRRHAQAQTMERLRLPRGVLADAEDFRASVTCRTTPMGVELALLCSTPQEIAGREPRQPPRSGSPCCSMARRSWMTAPARPCAPAISPMAPPVAALPFQRLSPAVHQHSARR